MPHLTTPAIARQLGTLFDDGSLVGLSDRQLIERFNRRRDEAAFAALVARHGPMVLGLCRQLLADRHLAEDAFQATFLVLARKARSLRDPDLLGTWLYGVALRTARKARSRLARQRIHEQGDVMDALAASVEPTALPADQALLDRDQAEALHREIDRLPGIFRSPIVLCYFEGLTLDEAARQLHCPAGTLRSRLARAREKLRDALTRRGVVLAAALDNRLAPASVSPHFCDLTARAALRFAARQAVASTAAALAREVLRAMTIRKLTVASTVLLVAALAAGAGYHATNVTTRSREGEPPGEPIAQTARTEPRPPDGSPTAAPGRMFVVGHVLDPDGQPVPRATVMVYAARKLLARDTVYDQWFPSAIGQARSDDAGRLRVDATRTTSARHHGVGAVAMAPGYGAGWVELDPDDDQPAAEISLRPEQAIEGRLFDLGGQPVGGVEVTVQAMVRVVPAPPWPDGRESTDGPSFSPYHGNDLPAWPRPAFSDADGRFTLRGVGCGIRVVLGIQDPRFAQLRAPFDTDDTSRSKSVTLALEPARIIAGRVTDAETDQPIPHARLEVLSYKDGAGTVNLFEADDQGRFRMNPLAANRYVVEAKCPAGQPYLDATAPIFDWPKGAVEHRLDLAMHRGTLIRGKVVEEGTGRPVAGARVSFRSTRRRDEATGAGNSRAETAPDGSFQLAVLPAPGYLIVLGPSDDYVYQEIGDRVVDEGRPGGRRFYAHAFVPHEPKPGSDGPEVRVPLRRGGTVKGRVVGPAGGPIASATMIGRIFLAPSPGVWLFWRVDHTGRVRDGRFEVHGLDPDTEVPVHFFEPQGKLGATAKFSARSGANGPVTIQLEPCGTATARLVDRAGKPVAGYPGRRLIMMVVTPGLSGRPDQSGRLTANEASALRIDPLNYGKGPVSDAEGRISLPALIPGATYSVRTGPRGSPPTFRSKDFTVKPGETLDLGDVPIDKPPR